MDRIEIAQLDDIDNYVDKDNLWKDFGGNVEYTSDNLVQSVTEYNFSKKLKLRSISKKDKGETLKTSKTKKTDKKRKSKSLSRSRHKSDEEKKKKLLEEIPIDEIPPEVVDQLKNHSDEHRTYEHSEVESSVVSDDSHSDTTSDNKSKEKNSETKKSSKERSIKSSKKET